MRGLAHVTRMHSLTLPHPSSVSTGHPASSLTSGLGLLGLGRPFHAQQPHEAPVTPHPFAHAHGSLYRASGTNPSASGMSAVAAHRTSSTNAGSQHALMHVNRSTPRQSMHDMAPSHGRQHADADPPMQMHDPHDALGLGLTVVAVDPFDSDAARHIFSPETLLAPSCQQQDQQHGMPAAGQQQQQGGSSSRPRAPFGTAASAAAAAGGSHGAPAAAAAADAESLLLRYDVSDDRPEGVEEGVWVRVLEMRDAKLQLEQVGTET